MSLRTLAEADLALIVEDDVGGFGWPLILTDPAGTVTPGLVGLSNDIAQLIDPETGMMVSGRQATVALRMSSLPGGVVPVGVADDTSKPWTVTFDDILSTAHTFKVRQSNPDRGLGLLSLVLEVYAP